MQLESPLDLEARQFNYIYENEIEVFEINELSVKAPDDAPCINVLIRGMLDYKLQKQLCKPKSDGCIATPLNKKYAKKSIQRSSH